MLAVIALQQPTESNDCLAPRTCSGFEESLATVAQASRGWGEQNKTLGNGFVFILPERFQSTVLGYGMFSLHFLGPNSSAT